MRFDIFMSPICDFLLKNTFAKFCFARELQGYNESHMFCPLPPRHSLFRHCFRTFVSVFGICKLFYRRGHKASRGGSYNQRPLLPFRKKSLARRNQKDFFQTIFSKGFFLDENLKSPVYLLYKSKITHPRHI